LFTSGRDRGQRQAVFSDVFAPFINVKVENPPCGEPAENV